ncbi:hypothetical protein BESB_056460 [Besnoitia besnoiti]|uniref:Uncharacterized protein n=1 Tax=Besnoitia besnoiti TaxID=94643 RepID=A0A2A9MDC6_BESBE|nr:hypothetical protein BESB_056460 [Besnoitia besnoiti]PFH35995.1 hypothetical protein BESB_056460 [Besnoitia besnoiti]
MAASQLSSLAASKFFRSPARCFAAPTFSASSLSPRSKCGFLPSPSCLSMQRRFLGNRATGPQFDLLDPKSINLKQEAAYVCRLFHLPSLNYLDFKQGCCSLRVFVLLAMLAGISVDLLLFHPPKSSYWNRWQVHRWPLSAERLLFPGKGNVFEYRKEGAKVDPATGAVQTEACAAYLKLMYGA